MIAARSATPSPPASGTRRTVNPRKSSVDEETRLLPGDTPRSDGGYGINEVRDPRHICLDIQDISVELGETTPLLEGRPGPASDGERDIETKHEPPKTVSVDALCTTAHEYLSTISDEQSSPRDTERAVKYLGKLIQAHPESISDLREAIFEKAKKTLIKAYQPKVLDPTRGEYPGHGYIGYTQEIESSTMKRLGKVLESLSDDDGVRISVKWDIKQESDKDDEPIRYKLLITKTDTTTDETKSFGFGTHGKTESFNPQSLVGYLGAFEDGRRHGNGIVRTKSAIYCGIFVEGKLPKGICSKRSFMTPWSSHEEKYEGEFDESLNPHGEGSLIYNFHKYVGQFEHGKLQGHGISERTEYGTRHRYEGEFLDGMPHGRCKYSYSGWDGSPYSSSLGTGFELEGDFDHGRLMRGTITYTDGRKYTDTEWKWDAAEPRYHSIYTGYLILRVPTHIHNVGEGSGTVTFPDGRKYVGALKNGKFHGKSKLTFPDGKIYNGDFKDDRFHGQGTVIFTNGTMYKGTWSQGDNQGPGTLYDTDGTTVLRTYDKPLFHKKTIPRPIAS
jgi:hypothetical protein